MWHWDQGRLPYFQFDALRSIAAAALSHDLKAIQRPTLVALTDLPFAAPETHSVWRNYSRVMKLCLLVYEKGGVAVATPVAYLLATDQTFTCDEYFHFIAQATSDPSPALRGWDAEAQLRFPLLFALRYVHVANSRWERNGIPIDEILGAYDLSGFNGNESDDDISNFMASYPAEALANAGYQIDDRPRRQARESLIVLSQLSYLNVQNHILFVDLPADNSLTISRALRGISGPSAENPNDEISRLAGLVSQQSFNFLDGGHLEDKFENTGFTEGTKVHKTHIVIERNANLRKEFFAQRATAVCDFCAQDTAKRYPWTEGVIDLHHLLPLSSGVQAGSLAGTSLDDIVPVCPTCHRAVHRFYNSWLSDRDYSDFLSIAQSKSVYKEAKHEFHSGNNESS